MMKSNLVKRAMGFVLATTLVMGSLTGCGNTAPANSQESKKEEHSSEVKSSSVLESKVESEVVEEIGVTYPLAGGKKLSIGVITNGAITAHYKDLSETPFWEAWQEETGVELELVEVADETALNLLYAGGKLPDIIIANITNYTGGASQAIEDKIVVPMNDYMEYAPDLQAVFDANEIYYKSAVTPAGDIIGFPSIHGDEFLCTSYGMIVRADWLEDLNMEAPRTPDEFYDMLVAFKEQKGAEVPLSVTPGAMRNYLLDMGILTSGFGLPAGNFYQVDGEVHFGYAESEYKDVLVWLNKLYEEKLLDNNFATLDGSMTKGNILSGRSGVNSGTPGGNLGSWLDSMAEDPEYDLTGIPSLSTEAGEKSMGGHRNQAVNGNYAFITGSCEDIETAAKFLNYGYSEDGHMFFNFGVEGESYTMEGDKAIYSDFITANADGWTVQQAMAAYCMGWTAGPFVQDKGYAEQYFSKPQQQEALTAWTDNDRGDYVMPSISINPDDITEYSNIASEIDVYVKEMQVKFITGVVSLDTFETEYLPTLEKMGVARYIEIQQNALDEFNSR